MLNWNGNGRIDPVDVGSSLSALSCVEKDAVDLCGYPFQFIQELEPEKNAFGKIKTFDPKIRYYKKSSTQLNKYGDGPFCRFPLNSNRFLGICGVYALFDSQDLLYVGRTQNFAQRFNQGYGIISPKNCYIGGQSTNCKINSMILRKYVCGEHIYLYFHQTSQYTSIESKLIQALAPPYNGTVPSHQDQIETNTDDINRAENLTEGRKNMSKYDALFSYLSKQTASELTLTFEEIKGILEFRLPRSAYNYPAWWSNSKTKDHSYSHAWQDAGYKTAGCSSSIWKHQITFVKN